MKQKLKNWLSGTRLAALMLVLISGAALAGVFVISSFNTSTEGWTPGGDGINPVWVSSGGDPGGYLNITDGAQGPMWFFVAPSEYTGNKSGAFGQNLTYSLRLSSNNGWMPDFGDVFLDGNGQTIAADSGPAPGTSWERFGVTLDSSGGWRFDDLSGAVATDAEIAAVLANLTGVRIRGEYTSGSDNADLDSVVMGEPGPIPALGPIGLGILAALLVGIAVFGLRRKARETGST